LLFPNLLNTVLSWPNTVKLIDLNSPGEFANPSSSRNGVRSS
jgi:hypothetical protein